MKTKLPFMQPDNFIHHLQQLDTHWQQMQAMLQPPVSTNKSSAIKNLVIGAVVLLGIAGLGAFLFFNNNKNKDGKNKNNLTTTTTIVPNNNNVMVDSNENNNVAIDTNFITSITPISNPEIDFDNNYFSTDDSIFSNIKIKVTPCETCTDTLATIPTAINKVQLLKDVLSTLEKKEELFIINNQHDTLIQCKEGTMLLIPANSLSGANNVEFSVKEFYKESDIVLNQLTTLSDKNQLISGGMLQLTATANGKNITVNPATPIKIYLPDTSASNMLDMQLFNGQEVNSPLEQTTIATPILSVRSINWVPQNQYFQKKKMITQVRVLNIIDQPFKIKERSKGNIGYFTIEEDSLVIDKELLKQQLKEKFGYYKVKLRYNNRDRFRSATDRDYDYIYAKKIGDSVWMDKTMADRNKLTGTASRQLMVNESYNDLVTTTTNQNFFNGIYSPSVINSLNNKFSININKLGWINCDKFYRDKRNKIQFTVNLNDSAKNYQTMLVFDRIKSIMNGYAVGNKVIFTDVPEGEKVRVVSIGIDQSNKLIVAVQPAIINQTALSGIKFEQSTPVQLATSLSKIDK
jgi:hypothetical protein